jgi:hypothetical protein
VNQAKSYFVVLAFAFSKELLVHTFGSGSIHCSILHVIPSMKKTNVTIAVVRKCFWFRGDILLLGMLKGATD